MIPDYSARPYLPPDGPRWVRGADHTTRQTDGRGVEWCVSRTENGGRVIHWYAVGPYREARTEITAADPRYPTDAELVAMMADRVERVRATGNGQVPAVAALAWQTLAPLASQH